MRNYFYQDSHLHLTDPHCVWRPLEFLTHAKNAGIRRLFSNTAEEKEWQQLLHFSSYHAEITPFIGIHPWFAGTVTPGWNERLEAQMQTAWCGIGEIGLDKKCGVDEVVQEKVFMDQLALASIFHRPISIHCLGRWGKLLELLQAAHKNYQVPPIMIHSYAGSAEIMHQLIDIGCYLSFSPNALGQPKSFAVLKKTPLHHLLLETDAPNQVHRSCAHYTPEILMNLYNGVANLHSIRVEQLAQQLWKNGSIFTTRSPDRQRETG